MITVPRSPLSTALLASSLLLSAAPGLVAQEVADIRPPLVQEKGIDPRSAEQARELLAQMLEAHGGAERFRSFSTAEVVARDEWPNPEARAQYNPWPEDDQKVRYQFLLGTFEARAEIVEGEGAGEVRGIQRWATYRQPPGSELEFSPDPLMTFFLPTYQYFFEMPFRLAEAPVVGYAGEDEFLGERYRLVLATWETHEPHPEHDQYLLWIHQPTGRLDLVQYTIREFTPSATGAVHFEDYREVQGLLVPFRQTIGPPAGEWYLHRIELDEVSFKKDVPRSLFFPDPSRAGEKPGPGPYRAP